MRDDPGDPARIPELPGRRPHGLWILAGDNYNHPVWHIDPKYTLLKSVVQYSHLYGWPAPADERIQLITNSSIVPNMVARVVTGAAKLKEAMVWAETEMQRLFAK